MQTKLSTEFGNRNDLRMRPVVFKCDLWQCSKLTTALRQNAGLRRKRLSPTVEISAFQRRVLFDFAGRTIQSGEHCSIEDSRAALDLYKLVEDEWENELAENPSTNEDDACFSDSDQPIEEDFLNDEFWPEDV